MSDRLHPNINGVVFFNPGTGPVDDAYADDAWRNLKAFIADLGLVGVHYRRMKKHDYGNGRYAYQLRYQGRKVEIQMPGWELARVRFTGAKEQNPWDYPRLYVDDSSWLWQFAVSCAKADLTGETDE